MKRNVNLPPPALNAPLRAWSNYLGWVSAAADFQVVGGVCRCTVTMPEGQMLEVQAATPDLLAKQVMAGLTANMVVPPTMDRSTISSLQDAPKQPKQHQKQQQQQGEPGQDEPGPVIPEGLKTQASPQEVSMRSHYEPALPRASQAPRSASVSSTKGTLQTVGVYVPVAMHEVLKAVAEEQGKKFSVLVREMVERGYERFEDAIEERSGRKVLDGYEQKVASYDGQSEQWMARLDRKLSLELKLTAKEYGRSASQIVGGLLAEELSHCPQAQAVSTTAQAVATTAARVIADPAEVVRSQAAIAGVVGPKANELANHLGLPGKRRLVNEVLVGIVRAPGVLMRDIAEYFQVSPEAMNVAVSLNFRQLAAPSFKAPNGQPRVVTEPVSWEEAVKALHLPHDEEAQLLGLGD
jgi:predicted DNA-binding protein